MDGKGKWAVAGVPHKGWKCTHIEDLGAPNVTCEMCESQEIRYVHIMMHPDYPHELECGCICAGNMEEDKKGAVKRENELKNAVRRRKNWPDLKKWKISKKGNSYISVDGYVVTIFQNKDGCWSGSIKKPSTNFQRFARKEYATERKAKLASFDALIFLKSRNCPANK